MISIPDHFSDESKIWIYPSNKKLNPGEFAHIDSNLDSFVQNWVSHNQQLKAYGTIYMDQIIVLLVDETKASASGCSIDSSVGFIKQMGQQLEIDFFNRWNFLYLVDNEVIKMVSKEQFQQDFENGVINLDTLFFDPLVKTLSEFKTDFIKPLGKSWHKNFLNV